MSEPEYPDALVDGPARGRGTNLNPANRFQDVRLHVLGEHLDHERADEEDSAQRSVLTRVLADHSRTIINRVDPEKSPDIHFSFTLNPYRGCEHGCIYCYARPTHEYLGYSSGLEFETTILAKHDAPELLRARLSGRQWKPEPIVMSGITDPYQPVERELRITRRCLEVMVQARQPVAVITKSRLVTRDIDLLSELAQHGAAHVALSLTTLDRDLARVLEPRASVPAERLRAIEELSAAGVPVNVMVAPVIPGLNDRGIPQTLRAAADAGAQSAGYVLLRLPYQIKALFLEWLARHFPERARHVESLIRDTRQGLLYDPRHGVRQRGAGPVAEQIRQLFATFARRHKLDRRMPALSGAAFRRPAERAASSAQLPLFEQ